MIKDLVKNIVIDSVVKDILGDSGDAAVANLELEDGNDYLLEDGGFLLLE